MPEYLDDPSVLTKDKLKSELVAHNVELPSGNPTKDVYVQLYLKNLTVQNQKNAVAVVLDAFSSDEELPPVVAPNRRRSSGRKAARKSDKHHLDVASLTDESLRDELQKHGMKVGPIVDSTRELYQKKLQKFLDDSPAQLFPTEIQVNHNSNSEPEVYSDTEDVAVAVPEPVIEPELVPVVETQVRNRGKSPASSHNNSSSSSQNQAVEKITASDQMLKVEKDVLKELFPDINSPTGISASCRKPIRGAAGRPLISSDLWSDENSCPSPKTTKTSSYSYTGSHAVNRMSSLNPSTSFTSSSSSSSKLSVTAPSAGPTRAVRCSMTLWKKLALFAILATFVIFVYLAMETNSVSPFQASDSKSFASGTA
ncbi:lamina-associated polypeptide 2, isoforms beta/delta/epsilon/gamma-like isoform X1 [Poecilia formosa]|uniref:lamina-associated polypeptide 2, isoforms beta/delta/epsilon/gamma-like isoform X1 n=1 Tax=Poecilia formosa TaxID=48698 RepID=UPI000443A985|nr:PREDICTED: lamina-associated polypeptide 2, isoforms beta/delta/epsilon/gamma-like isoform X1 [Poecilia formosa]